MLPVDGAGLSLAFAPDRRLPLGASDDTAALAERLQFTVGEGPCQAAHATGERVVAGEAEIGSRWPAFAELLTTRTPFRAVLSVPLADELRGIGALDVFLAPPRDVRDVRLPDVLAVATAIAATLSNPTTAPHREEGPAWLDAPAADRRALVWQAIGYVNAGLEVSSTDALALLRGHAWAQGRDLDDVARAVLEQQLPLQNLALDAGTSF
ncbi:GAF domain-containing protein [Modestobacter lapidis]